MNRLASLLCCSHLCLPSFRYSAEPDACIWRQNFSYDGAPITVINKRFFDAWAQKDAASQFHAYKCAFGCTKAAIFSTNAIVIDSENWRNFPGRLVNEARIHNEDGTVGPHPELTNCVLGERFCLSMPAYFAHNLNLIGTAHTLHDHLGRKCVSVMATKQISVMATNIFSVMTTKLFSVPAANIFP